MPLLGYSNPYARNGIPTTTPLRPATQVAPNQMTPPPGLSGADLADWARAHGGATSAAASLGQTEAIGQGNQMAGAGAMNTASNMAAARANPIAMPQVGGYQPGSYNVPYGTWDNAKSYANPYAFNIPGYGQSNPITGQQATMDNIKPYLNPFLDQILANGTSQITHSGAGQGLFGSTGNINDIGTWATNASSKAYGDAMNAFNQDRGYFNDQDWSRYGAGVDAGNTAMQNFNNDRSFMSDQYWKGRTADTQDYWNTYNANWDQYKYGNADYQGRLGDYYSQNKDITGAEQGAANKTGDLYSYLSDAISKLYGDSGNAAAAGGIAGSNANRGLIGNILGMFLGG